MGWFGGDPGVPVIINGKETFPLVPVAVGLYSTAFNVFNTLLLFPFIGVFDRVLSRRRPHASEDVEDYSQPRFLTRRPARRPRPRRAARCSRRPAATSRRADAVPGDRARGDPTRPTTFKEHFAARSTSSAAISAPTPPRCSGPDMPYAEADLVASLIEEEDFTASLGETLYQIARRVERQTFSAGRPGARPRGARPRSPRRMRAIVAARRRRPSVSPRRSAAVCRPLLALARACLQLGAELPWAERGAILACSAAPSAPSC